MGLGSLLNLNSERIDIARCVLVLNGIDVELSANSFRQIMGLKDRGMPIVLEGENTKVESDLKLLRASSRGINIKDLEEILSNLTAADDRFKVIFMLFALCTVLCPPGGVHISSGFLFSLKDAKSIQKRNWATFCFHRFIQGITRYKEENLAYIGGCLLYLEMLYLNSILYAKVRRDRSMCPLAVWITDEIKQLMKWIEHKSGYGSTEIRVSTAVVKCDNRCEDGSSKAAEEENCDVKSGDTETVSGMKKANMISYLEIPALMSKSHGGSSDMSMKKQRVYRSPQCNKEMEKDSSERIDREKICNYCLSYEPSCSGTSGCVDTHNEINGKEDSKSKEDMDCVHLLHSDIETWMPAVCVEKLHRNEQNKGCVGRLQSGMRSKRLADVHMCNGKCGGRVHGELEVFKNYPERSHYRVGPYLMPRPFDIDAES
ncbi:hypothetical protein CUMW_218000 [Citrus unshiu]|uniref:Aminotransferase-like plant mobile domain-containing protein n=1 Tax=Citrus unshiu TaxID=55188 RepID=A0A2H5QCV9_CITUN|nr:hypothetical protein CUMW_218000 [Citrus unshiu]